MTLSDVCRRLEISRASANRLIPKLRGYKVGRQWRFDSADVETFVEAQKLIVESRETPRPFVSFPRHNVPSVHAWPGSERYS